MSIHIRARLLPGGEQPVFELGQGASIAYAVVTDARYKLIPLDKVVGLSWERDTLDEHLGTLIFECHVEDVRKAAGFIQGYLIPCTNGFEAVTPDTLRRIADEWQVKREKL